ncbi:MAG: hypothetical protein Q7R64_00635 [bacterium]|nr:hypothetical protein [bacterium]
MDTPNHTPKSEAEQPPAEVAEVFSVQEALDTRGFQAFYDKTRPDDNVFDDPKDTQDVFKIFEASQSVARRFEVAMTAKLRGQNKGILTPEDRLACKKHVEDLADKDPKALLELQNDLNALETDPADIAKKEAEFASLREELKPEKFQAEKVLLETRKIEIERANAERVGTAYGFLDRTLSYIGKGKKAEDAKKQEKRDAEWEKLDADIKEVTRKITDAPKVIAEEQATLKKIKDRLEVARERVFMENDVAKKVRERLLDETDKVLEEAIVSTDLPKKQKGAKKFMSEVKLAESGDNFLDEGDGPHREAYMRVLWEGGTSEDGKQAVGMKELFEKGIQEAIGALPPDAGQSRVLRAYRSFMRMAGAEEGTIGFLDEAESKEFVLRTLETAEEEAKKKHSGTGKRIYYQVLIKHLKDTSPITV